MGQPSIQVVISWDVLHFIVHSGNMTTAENWRELEPEARASIEAMMLDSFEQWWVGALAGEHVDRRPDTYFPCSDVLAARAIFLDTDVVIAAVAGHYIMVSPEGIASNWKELEPEARAFVLPRMIERWEPWWAQRQRESGELPNEMFGCPSALARRATVVDPSLLSIADEDLEALGKAERSRRRFYRHLLEKEEVESF